MFTITFNAINFEFIRFTNMFRLKKMKQSPFFKIFFSIIYFRTEDNKISRTEVDDQIQIVDICENKDEELKEKSK